MFIGQEKLRNELGYILADVVNGSNHNILLSASPGYGKTTLGFLFLSHSGLSYHYAIPDKTGITLDLSKRIQFVDEIHLLEQPEIIYNYMDRGTDTFLFATNEIGRLKEPLTSRCITLVFEEYTMEEQKQIVNSYMKNLPEDIKEYIANISGGIPRIIKVLCTRLNYIVKNYNNISSSEEYKNIITNIMNIKDGYTEIERRYIAYLKECGGRASIEAICNGINLEKSLIMRDIEPKLIHQGVIQVTMKGRELQ